MTIAMSVTENRRLSHLGEARQFVLAEINPQSRTIVNSQAIEAPPHEPGSFPRWLHERRVRVLIAAGVGRRALDNLTHHGIAVKIGRHGASPESLAADWLAEAFIAILNGCDQQSDEAADHECRLSGYLRNQPS